MKIGSFPVEKLEGGLHNNMSQMFRSVRQSDYNRIDDEGAS